MRELRMFSLWVLYALLGGITMTSCVMEDDSLNAQAKTGMVQFGVTSNTGFQTKAIDETYYQDLTNFTVQILDGTSTIVETFVGNALPEVYELENGSYTLKAFCGKDTPATITDMYVEGSTSFRVESNTQTVELACKPVCAKVVVKFGKEMDTYFSDYKVVFETDALRKVGEVFSWQKASTDPVYLKVMEKEFVKVMIKLTKKEGYSSSDVEKTYDLSPLDALTVNIAPSLSSGKLGISISVDDRTNDKPIDIEIPSDWI